MLRVLVFLAAVAAMPAAPIAAQPVQTGFLDRVITVAGQTYRYQVYVPARYSATEAWPVILFLHGAGERGSDGLLQTTVGLGPAIRRNATRYPAIVVFPQVPADSLWSGIPAQMALAALRQTMADFGTDPARLYLTGLSMGGRGTWYLAYRNPDLFAAVAPICGWVIPVPFDSRFDPVVPVDSGPALPALARRLQRVPIWIFHGEVDRVVPVAGSRDPAAALGAANADVRYTELLGVDHNAWDAAYGSDEFVRWLFAQRRPRP
ncbi:MAG: dienelactone hydrolase family protein [Gemmatimonadetes bacterium]|nr:dienelactone hydrolase family protein [Gemmatimonadota bacterium]